MSDGEIRCSRCHRVVLKGVELFKGKIVCRRCKKKDKDVFFKSPSCTLSVINGRGDREIADLN